MGFLVERKAASGRVETENKNEIFQLQTNKHDSRQDLVVVKKSICNQEGKTVA